MANPYRNTGRAGSSSPANNIGKHLLKPLIEAGKRVIKSFSKPKLKTSLTKEQMDIITPELMRRNKVQIDNLRKWDQFQQSRNKPMSARDAKFFNPDGSSKTGNLYSSHQSRMSSDFDNVLGDVTPKQGKIKYKKSYHENEVLEPPSGYYSSDGKGWPLPLNKGDL